ncbi:MAG TPA: RNA polymerase factor sigma-32 [Myxococcota bacterium]|nr:RNA polymerase factor sigma-32 [Myxococcota bacterium]HRY94687.1 RNA polymerase factor sigma-32 [Myxococcota bacterium]
MDDDRAEHDLEAEAEADAAAEAEAEAEAAAEAETEARAEAGASAVASRALARSDSGRLAPLDALQRYLNEIGRFELLTPEQERELAIKLQDSGDPQYAYRLVTANLRLVVKIALEHRSYYQNLLDLIQEGNIGLMQAVKRFDPYRGVRLPTYAQFWIHAYILKFILENFSLVKIGTTQAQRKLFFRLKKEKERLMREGYDPDTKLLAERIDVSEKDVTEMEKRLAGPEASLDATHPVTERSMLDTLAIPGLSPEELVADEELREHVRQAMQDFRATLDEREAAIWDARIAAENPATFQELGDKHGITRQRVQQVEQRLKLRFQEFLQKDLPDPGGRID